MLPELSVFNEAKRKDVFYTDVERESLLEWIFARSGFGPLVLRQWAQTLGRSDYQAAIRQWQLFIYNDKDTVIEKYINTPCRTWRGGSRINHIDRYITAYHLAAKTPVPAEQTASILARSVEEVWTIMKDPKVVGQVTAIIARRERAEAKARAKAVVNV